MLRTVRTWQHVVVGLVILLIALIVGFGFLGAGDESVLRPEHFDSKQVTVWPAGADGVRIREVVDIDFGPNQRHGYQRKIFNDFGAPVDITASSPDANARVDIVPVGNRTRIRLGDPNAVFTDRHRYVLEYTLPDANVSSGVLALDIIGTDETFETERFEVVLAGFDFDGTECDTGGSHAFGGCEFERDADGNQVAVIEPLAPHDGISVGGRFSSTNADPALPPEPPQPDQVTFGFHRLGLLMIPLGLVAAALVYLIGRRYGSNEVVGAGGAADVAYGNLPIPGGGGAPRDVATYRVPDSRLADMATIEFAPPRGLEPWQASVLLREKIDEKTVSAWFSEMIANDALVVDGDQAGGLRLRPGSNTAQLSRVDRGHIAGLFASGDEIELGSYDQEFNRSWKAIEQEQRGFVRDAGWWSHGGPRSVSTPWRIVAVALVTGLIPFALAIGLSMSASAWRTIMSPWVAMIVGFLVPLVVAALAYQPMFAARTATGSALALRSESFRRFLAASEGKHVDWAWEHGLLREYSAWAVALGAAEAWSDAIGSSDIPAPGLVSLTGPLVMYSSASAFQSTHVAPSSSGGGGGGVGGGGGGGSSGSW